MNDEPHLCGNAKVRYDEQLKFFQERLTGELMLIAIRLKKVLHSHRLDLHDVSDVQIQNPFVLVKEAQNRAHVNLVSVFLFFRLGLRVNLEVSILDIAFIVFIIAHN